MLPLIYLIFTAGKLILTCHSFHVHINYLTRLKNQKKIYTIKEKNTLKEGFNFFDITNTKKILIVSKFIKIHYLCVFKLKILFKVLISKKNYISQ